MTSINHEAFAAITGWLAWNSGGQVDKILPNGFKGSVGGGDAWDEEQWCSDRVEAAILVYKSSWGSPNIAAMALRRWLKEMYWLVEPSSKHGQYEHLVVAEVQKFAELLREECLKHPRVKRFTTV